MKLHQPTQKPEVCHAALIQHQLQAHHVPAAAYMTQERCHNRSKASRTSGRSQNALRRQPASAAAPSVVHTAKTTWKHTERCTDNWQVHHQQRGNPGVTSNTLHEGGTWHHVSKPSKHLLLQPKSRLAAACMMPMDTVAVGNHPPSNQQRYQVDQPKVQTEQQHH